MKRANLVLDEQLLEETLRLSGERTYSKAVDRALSEFVRRAKAGRILDLAVARPIGLARGQFTVPDSFLEPLPDDVIESFEGGVDPSGK